MSLINLSSTGQDAEDFSVTVPDGLKIPKNSQVCLVSYNGTLNANPTPEVGSITGPDSVVNLEIREGVNDEFVVCRSNWDQADANALFGAQGHRPMCVKIPPGTYLRMSDVATVITNSLNAAEKDVSYQGDGAIHGRDLSSGGTLYATPGQGWICEVSTNAAGVVGLTVRQRRRTQWFDTRSTNLVCPAPIAGTSGGGLGVAAPFTIPRAASISRMYYLNSDTHDYSFNPNSFQDGNPSPSTLQPGPFMRVEPADMNLFRRSERTFDGSPLNPLVGVLPDERQNQSDYGFDNDYVDYKNLYVWWWDKPVFIGLTYDEATQSGGPPPVPVRSVGQNRYGFEWEFGNATVQNMPTQGTPNGGIFPSGSLTRWGTDPNSTPFPDWADLDNPDEIGDDYLCNFNGITVGLCPSSWGDFQEDGSPIMTQDWALTGDEFCRLPIAIKLLKRGPNERALWIWQTSSSEVEEAYPLQSEYANSIPYDPTATVIKACIVIDLDSSSARRGYVFKCFISQTTTVTPNWVQIDPGNPNPPTWDELDGTDFATRAEDWYPVCKIHNPSSWGVTNSVSPQPAYGFGIRDLSILLNMMWKDSVNPGSFRNPLGNSIFDGLAAGVDTFVGQPRFGSGFSILPKTFDQNSMVKAVRSGTISEEQYDWMERSGWFVANANCGENHFFTAVGLVSDDFPITSPTIANLDSFTIPASASGASQTVKQQSVFLQFNFGATITSAEPFYITMDVGSRNCHLATGDESHACTLLGEGHPLENLVRQRFSGYMRTAAWVDLNNARPITINRINVRLVNEVNKSYQLLHAFNCIVRFREKKSGRVIASEVDL